MTFTKTSEILFWLASSWFVLMAAWSFYECFGGKSWNIAMAGLLLSGVACFYSIVFAVYMHGGPRIGPELFFPSFVMGGFIVRALDFLMEHWTKGERPPELP